MARLVSHVHVRDDQGQPHVFGPDSAVPKWASERIPNPKAWAEPPAESSVEDSASAYPESPSEPEDATETPETEPPDEDAEDSPEPAESSATTRKSSPRRKG